MGEVTGMNGNISQAPIFCSREEGDYTLSVQSPAATARCGLMGAFPAASEFLDSVPPSDGPLQYALGLVLDGQEMKRLSWAKPGGSPLPTRTRLFEAQPNPFNPSTTIHFELEHAAHATLQVFNLSGRLVVTHLDGECRAGMNQATWHGRDAAHRKVSSGVYLYTLRVGRQLETKRMVLLK
jgi:hypothetical protein